MGLKYDASAIQKISVLILILNVIIWCIYGPFGRIQVYLNRVPFIPKRWDFIDRDLQFVYYTQQSLPNRRQRTLAFTEKMINYDFMDKMGFTMTQVDSCHGTIYRIENYYVSGHYGFASRGFRIHNWTYNGHSGLYKPRIGRIIESYKNVLVCGHEQCRIYGHFVLDLMSPLMLIPEEIKQKCLLLAPVCPFDVSEFIRFAGFENRTIFLKRREWIFAENIYFLMNPRPHGEYQSACLYNLSIAIKKYFNVDKVNPDSIGFHKREGTVRVISNIDELINSSSQVWKNEKFISVPDHFNTIKETALYYSQLKVLVAVAGSNLLNCMFMKEGTTLIEVMGQIWNSHITSPILVFNMYLVIISEPRLHHKKPTQIPVDFHDVKVALEAAFYVMANKTYPKIPKTVIY